MYTITTTSASSSSLSSHPHATLLVCRTKSIFHLFCYSFLIILISSFPSASYFSSSFSFLTLANCDTLASGVAAAAAAAPLPPPPPQLNPMLRTDTVQHRMERSADLYANENYSSSATTSVRAAAKIENRVDDLNRHKRSDRGTYGLPKAHVKQQFYDSTETRSNLPVNAAANDLTSLNLVTGAREDICKEHCSCPDTKNAFINVICDFQQNPKLSEVFGTNFRIPHHAFTITIKLAANTNFRLIHGFFNNNTVNSLIIEGTGSKRELVEFTTDSFLGNNGPYPDVQVNNVHSVFVRKKAFSGNCKFTVRNSNELILYENAFENAKINGLFVDINDLRINEKAFNLAQAKLRIESSTIFNIYRFEASLREIRFINCTIGTINGGTFDVITINSIMFEGCRIDSIKARAITEKLFSKHVSITGAIIGSIESEAIYGSGISELILTNNKIDTIHENAIHVTAINATISQNNIKHLGNNWLRVKEWSNIVIEKNQFGVFGRMSLEETKQPVTCHFDGNSITQPAPGSLNITNPYCRIRETSVNISCRCNLEWLTELSSHDLRSETYCTIDEKLGHCFNATTFNTLKYLNEVCDETKSTLDCIANRFLKKIDGHFFTPEELEQSKPRLLVIIVSGCIILFTIIVIVIIVTCCLCNRPKKHSNSSNQSVPITAITHTSNHRHEFSVEERHIIDQTMQLMQKKYPEIYKQINDRSQILLQHDLTDKKCVKVISQIVNLLNKVDNPGSDFIIFNQVLTQHLQPQNPTAPPSDPIYTEPGLTGLEGGFYTSSTIVAMPTEGYEGVVNHPNDNNGITGGGREDHLNIPEHIYAEPNCAQQPLLRNEYASPADRNVDAMDLYTEPINDRGNLIY